MKNSLLTKIAMSLVLTLGLAAKSFATSYSPNGIRVQYSSIGTGTDQVAKNAIDLIIQAATDAGHINNLISKVTGFEGDFSLCADFAPRTQHSYSQAISRVVVLRRNNKRRSITNSASTPHCTQDSLKYIDDSDLGPFAPKSHPSLKCTLDTFDPNPEKYHAELLISEEAIELFVMPKKQTYVGISLLQSSQSARYMPVDWEATEKYVGENGYIHYNSSTNGNIVLVPFINENGIQYSATYNKQNYSCSQPLPF